MWPCARKRFGCQSSRCVCLCDSCLSICVSLIGGVVLQPLRRVLEWVAYHRLLGVAHFYLYDRDGSLASPLQPLVDAGHSAELGLGCRMIHGVHTWWLCMTGALWQGW